MSKHVTSRSPQVRRLKVVGTVVFVIAFLTLFVGGAVGLIGSPDSDPAEVGAPPVASGSPAPGDASSSTLPSASDGPSGPTPSAPITPVAGPSDAPTPVVTGVPTQPVDESTQLKRTLAWLRRGLADETTFRIATLNVLGNSHTVPGGNKRGWASGVTRMGWAWSLIQQADLDVVGFQEMEEPQYARFMSLSGWAAYPGPTLDRGSIRDSIAWDPGVWELVEANSVSIPYFGGQSIRRPVVKLQNIASGRQVWFFNTHNPATTPSHGNNARWRAAAISIETELANQLGEDGTPVVFTGDYNDRAEAFCPLVGGTDLVAANGGSNDGSCSPPDRMDVDWIFGSGTQWLDFQSASAGITGRVTDHPFVYAEGYIPEEPLPGDPTDGPTDGPSASDSPQ